MKAHEILDTAKDLITGDRNKQNGAALKNHENIALLWTAYKRETFTPLDVANMMELLKIARGKSGDYNPDDYNDRAGYAALAGEFASVKPERECTEHSPNQFGAWVGQHGYHP